MQTIFRVQSAGSIDGKQKMVCYAFDFAPDRALKVLSEVHQLKKSAVGTDDAGRVALGEFLNFCPVLAEAETGMEPYDVSKMMRQLKKITVDGAIKSGFDDDSIYKADAGIVMDREKLNLVDILKKRLTPQKKEKKQTTVDVNRQGLSPEEYKRAQDAKRKPKRERTPEEQAALDKEKEQKKQQQGLFDLLRNVSIRLPLLIFGTAADFDESIRLAEFVDKVDAASWQVFMPKEVDKDLFLKLLVFYDEDVIEGAGMRIRRTAKAADELMPTRRVMKIAEIFTYFKNPAKETVLTPWRVVNMHMGDTIGGYNFYKEGYPMQDGLLDEPRLIEQGEVTSNLFLNENVRILEMNSKSGLYPLYVAYSIYRMMLPKDEEQMTLEEAQTWWQRALQDHLFVLCQTTMAVAITKRTLAGYTGAEVNAIYIPRLLDRMEDKQRLARKLTNPATWKKEGERLKFDAVVGNPPYQLSDGGNKASAVPIYNLFVEQAKQLQPKYISMIMPAKWYSGGRGLDSFRETMLNDSRIKLLFDYMDSNDCFAGVDIAGGVCYFLWDEAHSGGCQVTNISNSKRYSTMRELGTEDIFVRHGQSLSIIDKVRKNETVFYNQRVSSQKPFGLRTYVKPLDTGDINLRYNGGVGPFQRNLVSSGVEWIDKWKVIMSYLTYDHAGRTDKDGKRRIFSTTEVLPPLTVCTETYIVIDAFDSEQEAANLLMYLKTRFVRFLVAQVTTTQHLAKSSFTLVPIQDFSKPWTDAELYAKYGLTDEEIAFIEATIKPME